MKTVTTAILFLCCAVAVAQSPPPKVLVNFVVESPTFKDDLKEVDGRDRVPECHIRVGEKMRSTLASLFPYLHWVSTGPAEYTFTATLRDRQGTGGADTLLVYQGSTGLEIPSLTLFRWSESFDRDPGPLIENLESRVSAALAGGSKATIEQNFTNEVVLVKKVDVRGDLRTIVVPLIGLTTHDDSVFKVRFEDSLQTPGQMLLREPQAAQSGIFCRVKKFSLGEVESTQWDSRIPAKLQSAQNVRVMMELFRPQIFPGTSGGTVTDVR